MTAESKICLRVAAITGIDSMSCRRQISQALPYADVIELRLDYWRLLNLDEIRILRQEISLPVIFTVRKASQGGLCQLPEAERLALIWNLAMLNPEYIDLEYDVAPNWVTTFRLQFPNIHIIGSYHNFAETPADLVEFCRPLQNQNFNSLKVAFFAQDIRDTLRLLIFLRTASCEQAMTGIAMGEAGQISRILAPVVGSYFSYGCVEADDTAAPGQLTLKELTEIYGFTGLNRHSVIYALLGDPVSQSPGHHWHNQAFAKLGKNAVYVKCRVERSQLVEVMQLFRQLPFAGFSVTIPHKEAIVECVDDLFAEAAALGIVNTLVYKAGRYQGFNTDAGGCAYVLEQVLPIKNLRCLILGAGGSAKAIAYILGARGAHVSLCNRTLQRALEFKEKFAAKILDFNQLLSSSEFSYDIIINTLPATAFAEQCQNWKIPVNPAGVAMDIVLKPLETLFLENARQSGWRCINGEALFTAQAQRQLKIWFEK